MDRSEIRNLSAGATGISCGSPPNITHPLRLPVKPGGRQTERHVQIQHFERGEVLRDGIGQAFPSGHSRSVGASASDHAGDLYSMEQRWAEHIVNDSLDEGFDQEHKLRLALSCRLVIFLTLAAIALTLPAKSHKPSEEPGSSVPWTPLSISPLGVEWICAYMGRLVHRRVTCSMISPGTRQIGEHAYL